MTDVRLTAVNPEDSQVYPVACNDKGELLLDSGGATGDLDVTGNLTVAGSATFNSGNVVLGGDSGTGGVYVLDAYSYFRRDGADQPALDIYKGGELTIAFRNTGAATFAGSVKSKDNFFVDAIGDDQACFRTIRNGITTASILGNGSASFSGPVIVSRASSENAVFAGRLNGSSTNTSLIDAAGSAIFNSRVIAGTDALNDHTCIAYNSSSTNPTYYARNYDTNGGVFQGVNSSGATTTLIHANGDVYFAGNVTASNINFKLAPATVAAMPAPLIDEGFAADQELDLLSELIKMKLQIRDLNAFMQRSTQDDPET